jgi:hypothetical protein
MIKAYEVMRLATFQPHAAHWDSQGTFGKNCPECHRVYNLRNEADRLFEEAKRQKGV